MDISPQGLVLVRCVGRRKDGIPCRRPLSAVPPFYGMPSVTLLGSSTHASGKYELKRCPGCGCWVELRYSGLKVA